jgi:hypothetical protein
MSETTADRRPFFQRAIDEKARQFVSPETRDVVDFLAGRITSFWETKEFEEIEGVDTVSPMVVVFHPQGVGEGPRERVTNVVHEPAMPPDRSQLAKDLSRWIQQRGKITGGDFEVIVPMTEADGGLSTYAICYGRVRKLSEAERILRKIENMS